MEAQKVRGNNVQEGSIIKRIRAYSPLLVPLILNAVKKAETLTLALESKGFSPHNKISLKGRYKMRADGLDRAGALPSGGGLHGSDVFSCSPCIKNILIFY